MKPKSPCYNCDERAVGCHSECDLYLTYRRALDKYNELYRQQRDEMSPFDEHQLVMIEKHKKKRR